MLRYGLFAIFWLVIGASAGALPFWMDADKRVRLYVRVQSIVDTKTVMNVHDIMTTSNAIGYADRLRLLVTLEEKTRTHELFKPYRKHIEKIMSQLGTNQEKMQRTLAEAGKDVNTFNADKDNMKLAPTNTHLSIIREVAGRVYEQIGYELASSDNGKILIGDALRVSMPDGFRPNAVVDKTLMSLFFQSGELIETPFKWDAKTSQKKTP